MEKLEPFLAGAALFALIFLLVSVVYRGSLIYQGNETIRADLQRLDAQVDELNAELDLLAADLDAIGRSLDALVGN